MTNPRTMFDWNSRSGLRRKRSYQHSGLVMASVAALSFSCASAFQSSFPLFGTSSDHCRAPTTRLHVVTDPKKLLRMELSDPDVSDRKTLEELYLLSTDSGGLTGDMIEEPVRGHRSLAQEKVKGTNGAAKRPSTPRRSTRRMQFKGLSTVPNSRSRTRNSLSSTPPLSRHHAVIKGNSDVVQSSKSSTMPGFIERGSSDRQKAFKDGIKLAEGRSGRIHVDTPEAMVARGKANGEMMYKTSASVPDSMLQFVNEIHRIDRITPKEEVELGELTQEAIRIQRIYDGLVTKLDREPSDDEWCAASGKINMEAIDQAIEDGLEAKNRLVESNLRMVQGVVNVYIRNGLGGQYNAADLMQEGVMALIRAAEKFDPGRGFRFSTYAMYWIRSAIKRNHVYQSRVVTVPHRLFENHKRILRVEIELKQGLGRPPTKKELGDAVGMSEVQIERCLSAMQQKCFSLDQQLENPRKPMSTSAQDATMNELVADKSDDAAEKALKHFFIREDLIETIHRHLTEEEAHLLLLRYGLLDSIPQRLKNGPVTIAEVSRMVGLKPDKVRRMINKSLKQLQVAMGDECWLGFEREMS